MLVDLEDGAVRWSVTSRPLGPDTELESEAIGGAVDQLDSRHAQLGLHPAAMTAARPVVADPQRCRVGKAGPVAVGEGVLVHGRHEAVDGAATDLHDRIEDTRQGVCGRK
jgi:hypothetical protein